MPEPKLIAVKILLSRDVHQKIERRSQQCEWSVGQWCNRAIQWRLRCLESKGTVRGDMFEIEEEVSVQAEPPGNPEGN